MTSSTSITSVLTKLSEASQLTLSGSEPKPNIDMIVVGMRVFAVIATEPACGRVTTGVNSSVP